MGFNLLEIEPTKVSRDLSGYITYIYGPAKSGKTTLTTQGGNTLLLAWEVGYHALAGIFPIDVTSWADQKLILRELKKPEVKEKYHTIVVDTVDIAAKACEKYICSKNGVEKIGDIPYGNGYTLLKTEFEEVYRAITQMGYALFFISHDKEKTFKRKDGTEYNQIVPSCQSTLNEIVKNMADIYAYSEKYEDNGVAKVRLILRSSDNSADTGCRFKYIANSCEMSYEALSNALNEAIDKEAEISGKEFVTDERVSNVIVHNYDYEGLKAEANEVIGELMNINQEYYAPRITQVIEKIFGKGHKLSNATIEQVELISLVVTELNDLKAEAKAKEEESK